MPNPDDPSVLPAATRYLFENLLLVRGTDLSAPTPCRGWDLRRLLRHVGTSLADVAGVLAGGESPAPTRREPRAGAGRDPVAALRGGVVDFLLASKSPPAAGRCCQIHGRPVPADVVVVVGALEMALHAWDIAQACRTDRPIPTHLASALLCVSPPLAEAGLAAHVFARPRVAPPTATVSDQLLALFGREPAIR